MHIYFILQMHTLAWLSGPCDSFMTCVVSKTMESEASNSLSPMGQNLPHEAPATPHFSWVGHPPSQAACGESLAAGTYSSNEKV